MTNDLASIERVGGRLCLDFINTRTSHYAEDAREYVEDYSGLVAWLHGCEHGLEAHEATKLMAAARAHPRRAASMFADAIALRGVLYRLLEATSQDETPARADLDAFNRQATEALSKRRLTPAGGWHWQWNDDSALELPLWKVLASAVDLLLDDDPARLKQCPAPDGCGWLFYDTSKNQTRRWCSMRMCGNGAKARRFQRRLREGAR